MRSWPVQDAKNDLSHVIELARSNGPQTITRHGRPVVIVVAVEVFKKIKAQQETPLEFFRRLKGARLDLKRRKDLPRPIHMEERDHTFARLQKATYFSSL